MGTAGPRHKLGGGSSAARNRICARCQTPCYPQVDRASTRSVDEWEDVGNAYEVQNHQHHKHGQHNLQHATTGRQNVHVRLDCTDLLIIQGCNAQFRLFRINAHSN
mgnify:CR=1 FL=1